MKSLVKQFNFWYRKQYIQTVHWEYWPMWLVYMPVSFYFMYLSIKARSLFFFSASNPNIENGGMFFESKWLIYQQIPKELFPTTIFINREDTVAEIHKWMLEANINFPIIVKPDRGERGWLVKKIQSISELIKYKYSLNITFLIQSYVDLPVELSVFYYRHPDKSNGTISSITFKKLLTITGNGRDTIKELIFKNDRAFLQYLHLKKYSSLNFETILDNNQEIEIVPYGNHALGAMFVNYNHLITPKLITVFDTMSKKIEGFYFGRYDLRCSSIDDLLEGKNISILELNGAGAEPAHIYDPNFSYWKAQFVLAAHYKMMYEAAIANNKRGIDYMTFNSFKKIRSVEKKYKNNYLCI
jgi:hypothetical protein